MHHNTICAHCTAALAMQILAHSPAIAAQSTADGLALLLCSLLYYTLTSLLCTSCSFLQHAAQRHSRATLPVRHAFGKRSCARVPLRHRAPFATYMTRASRPFTPSTACSFMAHITHNILHRVRRLPGGLESPAAAPPLRGACRRLHASGTRKPPKLTASQASEPPSSALCHERPDSIAMCD